MIVEYWSIYPAPLSHRRQTKLPKVLETTKFNFWHFYILYFKFWLIVREENLNNRKKHNHRIWNGKQLSIYWKHNCNVVSVWSQQKTVNKHLHMLTSEGHFLTFCSIKQYDQQLMHFEITMWKKQLKNATHLMKLNKLLSLK